MRRMVLAGWLFGSLATVGTAAGQQAASVDRPCFLPRPRPACSAFFLTNGGAYMTLAGGSRYDTPLGAAADWTAMFNVSDHDAIGFGAFGNVNARAPAFGAQLTYRRWLRGPASLDVAVGLPLVSDTKPGSVYGTIRWSPVHWFGLTARPELVRMNSYVCDAFYNCQAETRSRGRFSVGMDVGGVPGLVATLSGGVAFLTLILALAGDD